MERNHILNDYERKNIQADIEFIEEYIQCLKMEMNKKYSFKDYMNEKVNSLIFYANALKENLKEGD